MSEAGSCPMCAGGWKLDHSRLHSTSLEQETCGLCSGTGVLPVGRRCECGRPATVLEGTCGPAEQCPARKGRTV